MHWLRRQHGQAQRVLQGLVLGVTVDDRRRARRAVAQESRGTISGRVVDTSGGVLPGVTVTIVNIGTNSTSTVVTSESGQFTAPSADIRRSIASRVELPASGSVVRETVEVRVGDRLQVDFTLEPAGVSTEVVVVGRIAAARIRHGHDGPGDRQQADWRDAAR